MSVEFEEKIKSKGGVGGLLKGYADIGWGLSIATALIVGLLCLVGLMSGEDSIAGISFMGIVLTILSLVVARFNTALIYAFGEIVHLLTDIRNSSNSNTANQTMQFNTTKNVDKLPEL